LTGARQAVGKKTAQLLKTRLDDPAALPVDHAIFAIQTHDGLPVGKATDFVKLRSDRPLATGIEITGLTVQASTRQTVLKLVDPSKLRRNRPATLTVDIAPLLPRLGAGETFCAEIVDFIRESGRDHPVELAIQQAPFAA